MTNEEMHRLVQEHKIENTKNMDIEQMGVRGNANEDAIDISKKMRTFAGGATRDTLANKPSYVKALSPSVLRHYVEYIGKHRVQSDGSLRDWDNWKKGIPQDVYLDGLARHFLSTWLLFDGFPASDNHGPVTIEDSICGVIFNAQGLLHEILKDKVNGKT